MGAGRGAGALGHGEQELRASSKHTELRSCQGAPRGWELSALSQHSWGIRAVVLVDAVVVVAVVVVAATELQQPRASPALRWHQPFGGQRDVCSASPMALQESTVLQGSCRHVYLCLEAQGFLYHRQVSV